MGIKKQELIDGCFAKAEDEEPLFVLRATDKLVPALVREWARQFANLHNRGEATDPNGKAWRKYLEALALADVMEQWPNRKMPD